MTQANKKLRIALLTHSTNPRGGVVHTLELAEALTRLGHEPVVHAPDEHGRGFFRETSCETVSVPAGAAPRPVFEMVEQRIDEYVSYFSRAETRSFDIWHAQDGISGNALAQLKLRGLVPAFVRTVHHIDAFADPRVVKLQQRAIETADHLLVVSRLWQETIARDYGREATLVSNGVDTSRFTPKPHGEHDAELRERFIPGEGRVYLAVGGIEQRKNTLRILGAFAQCRAVDPNARLVIAGGASVLDHTRYQNGFADALTFTGWPQGTVVVTGPLPQHLMPSLYRRADALVFPSVTEGFGLVVLEAMACGVPVITSRIAPFTEYLDDADVLWCDPCNDTSIAGTMLAATVPAIRTKLIAHGHALAARHDWLSSARTLLATYETLREACLA